MPTLFSSIRIRMMFGYAAILMVTLIAAVILTSSSKFVQGKVASFMQQTLPALNNINVLHSTSKELVLKGYSLYGTTLSPKQFQVDRQQLQQKLDNANTLLAKSLSTGQLDNNIDKVKDSLNNLYIVMNQSGVDWDLARDHLATLDQQAVQLTQELDKLRDVIATETGNSVDAIDMQLDRGFVIVMVLVSVLILVAVGAFWISKKQIAEPIVSLAQQLDIISSHRDLTKTIPKHTTTEVSSMAGSINGLLRMFQSGMADVNQAITSIDESVKQLGSSTQRSGKTVVKLQTDIESLVQVMARLEQDMQHSLEFSESAAGDAEQGADSMAEGQQKVEETAASIGELSDDIEVSAEKLLTLQSAGNQVSNVVKTIAEIASQTNLLALNAAIEAARAGESGRGFAVVADEVRTLAIRTQQSTDEINTLLANIVGSIETAVANMDSNQDKAKKSVDLANELVETLQTGRNRILSLVKVSNDAARLAANSKDISIEVRNQVQAFKHLGEDVSQGNESNTKAAGSLSQLATSLTKTLAQFKL
ncbi:methyl-accepting chemotaxis protein [Paraglaciecola arctica]|uniref:methyl-accepting chemotaxis protein n=1 Tax=Paraglaciecola arctica TaxID=1128911 RepID=UPI001C0797CB|nr:methyl-accepting chemotaxis protein [Paraglaciecola arctica]MBU3001993.1 methyl-accepting chemotaxis protein [Paraglaciecola arctica]